MNSKKLICRIKGGLGNQMFIYAACKHLAKLNNANLVIDNITGFKHDKLYKRKYRLNAFKLNIYYANYYEMFLPFDKIFRKFYKIFNNKNFIHETNLTYDEKFLNIRFNKICWVEGYWQDEKYFIDISDDIKNDFIIKNEYKESGKKYINLIMQTESVAVHFRNFNTSITNSNLDTNYYNKAISYLEARVNKPHYFIFVNNPSIEQKFYINKLNNFTIIETDSEITDMYLMTNCKYFIIANSSYSWWAAWLARYSNKIIIAPAKQQLNINSGFSSVEVPNNWVII